MSKFKVVEWVGLEDEASPLHEGGVREGCMPPNQKHFKILSVETLYYDPISSNLNE